MEPNSIFSLKTALIVGAALAAMYLGFAAKAAPTSGKIIPVLLRIVIPSNSHLFSDYIVVISNKVATLLNFMYA